MRLATRMHQANRRIIPESSLFTLLYQHLPLFSFVNTMSLIFDLLPSEFLNSILFCVSWGINLGESCRWADATLKVWEMWGSSPTLVSSE